MKPARHLHFASSQVRSTPIQACKSNHVGGAWLLGHRLGSQDLWRKSPVELGFCLGHYIVKDLGFAGDCIDCLKSCDIGTSTIIAMCAHVPVPWDGYQGRRPPYCPLCVLEDTELFSNPGLQVLWFRDCESSHHLRKPWSLIYISVLMFSQPLGQGPCPSTGTTNSACLTLNCFSWVLWKWGSWLGLSIPRLQVSKTLRMRYRIALEGAFSSSAHTCLHEYETPTEFVSYGLTQISRLS